MFSGRIAEGPFHLLLYGATFYIIISFLLKVKWLAITHRVEWVVWNVYAGMSRTVGHSHGSFAAHALAQEAIKTSYNR